MVDSSPPVAASVVVPTYRRPHALARCLSALAAQEPPAGGFEVIVVIDGEDGAQEALATARASPVAARVFVQANAGPAAARNHGASFARGRWLAFTDDDCRPAPGWLRALAPEVEREPEALVGGTVRNGLADNRSAAASQLVQDVSWEHFSRRGHPARFLPSNNIALTRRAFDRVGGFDAETFRRAAAEDRDLCDRALAAGLELRLAPAAIVDHFHELSPVALWRQHRHYGRGARRFQLARRRRGLPPLTANAGYYLALAASTFSRARSLRAVGFVALIATTQVAYVAGYVAETLHTRGSRR